MAGTHALYEDADRILSLYVPLQISEKLECCGCLPLATRVDEELHVPESVFLKELIVNPPLLAVGITCPTDFIPAQ